MKTIKIGNMELELTEERIKRIKEAIAETKRQIDREMAYSEEFRKHENIARWEAHIEYLKDLLA